MFPDLSEFNDPPYRASPVDWDALAEALRAGEIEAVAIRSSMGTLRADESFARNQAGARAAGIPATYYHFCYPQKNTPEAEAAFANQIIGPLVPREAMAGDFEDDGSFRWPRAGGVGLDWARRFLSALQAPVQATWWYASTSFIEDLGLWPLSSTWPLWGAAYPGPAPAGSTFHQFTDLGSTPGVAGVCDQSRVLIGPLSRWLTTGGDMPLDPNDPEVAHIHKTLDQVFNLVLFGRDGAAGDTALATGAKLAEVYNEVAQLAVAPVDVDALAEALAPLLPPETDPQDIATAVVQHLAKDLAAG